MKWLVKLTRVYSERHAIHEEAEIVVEAGGSVEAFQIAKAALDGDEIEWSEMKDEIVGSDFVHSEVKNVVERVPDDTPADFPREED